MKLPFGCSIQLLLVGFVVFPPGCKSHGPLARHLVLQDLSMVALIADAATTPGPFDEEESDYIDNPDMTLAARAGSDGVTEDRLSVLEGIPMELTVNVYGITDRAATEAYELENVEVSLWHCDAAGVYSAAAQEGTEGQKWLRGRQMTDSAGTVKFNTILPGLYLGRMAHYHIRLRLPGETDYAAVSQLYFSDTDVDQYRTIGIYRADADEITYSTTDGIYRSVDPQIRELLTLSMSGDYETSVSSKIALALITATIPSPIASSPTMQVTAPTSSVTTPNMPATMPIPAPTLPILAPNMSVPAMVSPTTPIVTAASPTEAGPVVVAPTLTFAPFPTVPISFLVPGTPVLQPTAVPVQSPVVTPVSAK